MIGIYRIKNLKNGKMYIGQSKNIRLRVTQHFSDLRGLRHGNQVLQRAWDKYGEANFIWEVLRECAPDELDFWEIFYISNLQSDRHSMGYNLEQGGVKTKPMADETKKKISLANTGRKRSAESRKKQSENMKGKYVGENNHRFGTHLTKEHAEKLHTASRNRIITDSERELRRQRATNITDETRKRRSIALSGNRNPMFGKVGILAPFFGKTHTDDTKHKMSKQKMGTKRTPESKEKGRLSHQGVPKGKGKTSAFVGVSINKRGKWVAYITYHGKSMNLGVFELEKDAAKAYNNKSLELYGTNAKINQI